MYVINHYIMLTIPHSINYYAGNARYPTKFCTLFRSKVISEATFPSDLPCAHLQSDLCVHLAAPENRATNFATKEVKY